MPSKSIPVAVRGEVDITLGNFGAGIYAAPPEISSAVLTYLDVTIVPPYTPAGPTQRFRFRAVARGLAIVTFRRMIGTSVIATVVDTVQVH